MSNNVSNFGRARLETVAMPGDLVCSEDSPLNFGVVCKYNDDVYVVRILEVATCTLAAPHDRTLRLALPQPLALQIEDGRSDFNRAGQIGFVNGRALLACHSEYRRAGGRHIHVDLSNWLIADEPDGGLWFGTWSLHAHDAFGKSVEVLRSAAAGKQGLR